MQMRASFQQEKLSELWTVPTNLLSHILSPWTLHMLLHFAGIFSHTICWESSLLQEPAKSPFISWTCAETISESKEITAAPVSTNNK
jgi:hypothetical protein